MRYGENEIKLDLEAIISKISRRSQLDLGYEIRSAMAAAGLTQSELAKRLGVSRQRVYQILSDGKKLRKSTLNKLKKVIDI